MQADTSPSLEPEALAALWPEPVRALASGIEVLDEVDSTNSHLMGRRRELQSGHVCLARRQTGGRGRRGRSWLSPAGGNLALSVLWRFPHPPQRLDGLSLALGVAARDALESLGVRGVGLKWPNDLYGQRGKLGGILVELASRHGEALTVVAGIGINRRLDESLEGVVGQPCTDLATLTGGRPPQLLPLAAAVSAAWLQAWQRFGREGLAPFLDEFERHHVLHDRKVQVSAAAGHLEGIVAGIDGSGGLRLLQGGQVITCRQGEVSVRQW
jgi:BirA family biotin operon repressor/biotin-[acetyl-CoA-carboxylase] ligase